ncbi:MULTISPECIES: hypothetical protein [Cupriavidus]|uniref:hypothetical protein n=1 Tax=Cupriavidus sp. DF5525 TaxID=3160989 RepID=UPI0032DFA58F
MTNIKKKDGLGNAGELDRLAEYPIQQEDRKVKFDEADRLGRNRAGGACAGNAVSTTLVQQGSC